MIYLAIDTDVWLHLAATGFDKEQNLFDELCYWIEAGVVNCIVPEQIVDEWHRNQENKIKRIKTAINASAGELQQVVKDDRSLNKLYSASNFESVSRGRAARIDKLFREQVLIAPVTKEIMICGWLILLSRKHTRQDVPTAGIGINEARVPFKVSIGTL